MKTYEKIRQLREQNHWTQENMAEKLGLSVAGYAKIENGKTHLTLQRLEQFSKIFNVDILDLIQNENNIFYQVNEKSYDNSQQGYIVHNHHTDTEQLTLKSEIEKLTLALSLKDDIIAQLKEQIAILNELNIALKHNKSQ